MKTLYVDESGHTGENLADPDQPLFAVATTDIEPALAKDILRTAFPRYQAQEFKFTHIWRRQSTRRRIPDFYRLLAEHTDRFYFFVCDKRYAFVSKMIDTLFEPLVRNAGYDFYADRYNWRYANMAFFGLTEIADPALIVALGQVWDRFARDPNETTLTKLQHRLTLMANSAPDGVRDFISGVAAGAEHFHAFHSFESVSGVNDLHVTSLVECLHHWRTKSDDQFHVVHDASSHFFSRAETWDRISSLAMPDTEIRYADDRSVQFPLRVTETVPARSDQSYSLQLADLIAGFATRFFRQDADAVERPLRDAIFEVAADHDNFGVVMPGTEFISGEPRRRSGPDVVDQMTELMFQRPRGGS